MLMKNAIVCMYKLILRPQLITNPSLTLVKSYSYTPMQPISITSFSIANAGKNYSKNVNYKKNLSQKI